MMNLWYNLRLASSGVRVLDDRGGSLYIGEASD
jgi:hypothetical protein